jgi:hypothetical protein
MSQGVGQKTRHDKEDKFKENEGKRGKTVDTWTIISSMFVCDVSLNQGQQDRTAQEFKKKGKTTQNKLRHEKTNEHNTTTTTHNTTRHRKANTKQEKKGKQINKKRKANDVTGCFFRFLPGFRGVLPGFFSHSGTVYVFLK